MQNRPLPSYASRATGPANAEEEINWNQRLVAVFALFVICFVAIALRLAFIQTQLKGEYISAFNTTRVEFESIPGRDGRIVTAQTVLATDISQYDVEVHYRWLEQPPNKNWLTQKSRERVPSGKRRTTARLDVARAEVIEVRDAMWRQFATISDVEFSQLTARRNDIQSRVERIAESVNRRHQTSSEVGTKPSSQTGLRGLIEQARREITSPPKRRSLAPIVVKEELAYHRIAENVPLEVAAEIRAHPELYPGLRVRESTARVYPESSLAAHLVGSRSRNPDLDHDHRVGRSGVERSYDGRLRGIDGRRKITFNRRGEIIDTEVIQQPTSGTDVVLTIDTDLQSIAESLLDAALNSRTETEGPPGGCILVMDAHSGEILTIANAPRFDVNLMVRPGGDAWNATVNDSRSPMFPRATQMTVPPGSVFKMLTAAAMLESSEINPLEHQYCQGFLESPKRHRCYIFRHFGVGHGNVTLRGALAQSCNVYFFKAARQMGPEPLAAWAHRFGFGQPTGIDLPFERRGNLPDPSKKTTGQSARWYPGDTLGLSIGQSRLTVTPLQVARMTAAIANGGFLVTPHVVVATSGPRSAGTYNWSIRPGQRIHGLSEKSISEIQTGLFSAVNDPGGTGYETVRLESVSIAGKTGTAEVGGGKPDHAWFAGYVPADRPRFAFVVMLENGGSGGKAAGPLAKQLVQGMLRLNLLQRTQISQLTDQP